MSLPLFLSRRLYGSDDDRREVSRPAVKIATAGVAIGIAVMIITVAVVVGFKHTIKGKVAGFGSHVQVVNVGNMQETDDQPLCVSDSLLRSFEALPGIAHSQRYAQTQGILKTDADFLGVVIKGMAQEYDTTFLHSCLIEGNMPPLNDSTSSRQLLLSKTIADKLRLSVGDRLFAYFINNDGVRPRRFTVCGLYQTNMSRFDSNVGITDLYTVQRINGWQGGQCSGAELITTDFNQLDSIYETAANAISLSPDANGNDMAAIPITDIYAQVFSWLELLDLNVWIILALMIAVAGFTMVSGLLIIILERTQMIGTLKALGATNTTIRHTFLWFAVFIIVKGMVWGNVLGIGLVLLQQYTGLVTLDPQTYYVSQAPVELHLLHVALINIVTLLVSTLVLVLPSFLVARVDPAKTMKYE